MAAPIQCISALRQNWRNGGELEQFKAMDRLISRCEVRQCSQKGPGVCVRESVVVAVTPFSPFHILLLLLLPTEFLRASSAWHRTPTGPRHTREHAEVSEPLGTQRWWHFDSYSVRANATFASAMYKHTPMPPFCYGTVYIRD